MLHWVKRSSRLFPHFGIFIMPPTAADEDFAGMDSTYWPSLGWCLPETRCASCRGCHWEGRASTGPAPGWQHKHTFELERALDLGPLRQCRTQLTASAPGRCTPPCSEPRGSCRTRGSSRRDTWAARTHLDTKTSNVIAGAPGVWHHLPSWDFITLVLAPNRDQLLHWWGGTSLSHGSPEKHKVG